MSSWSELATGSKGCDHSPGSRYHTVDVEVGRRGGKFRVEITEVWGSDQGYLEEHGRNRIVAIDADLDTAVRIANSRAQAAGMHQAYMIQALSSAHADAVDAIDDAS